MTTPEITNFRDDPADPPGRPSEPIALVRLLVALFVACAAVIAAPSGTTSGLPKAPVVVLTADDFRFGTYIIDQPGRYQLGEDISFNPNSPDTLRAAVAGGTPAASVALEEPIDAYQSGTPLVTQFAHGPTAPFSPGGPLDARYDPAAYGVGFFAAIAITADDVELDLAGHTIEQSPEHALLQRFFAVIELADQPFLPAQGPFDFGLGIDSANRVVIHNGTIGRSSHHGIHGNGNEDVTIAGVEFVDYEVAAVALNGVRGLDVHKVTATNRKDVPVLGTFSSAQFIKPYLDRLARPPVSTTTLTVDGAALDVATVRNALRRAINTTHADVMAGGAIDAAHEPEFGLFHNPHGVVDGNSYSFLVNSVGVAVNGFPTTPDAEVASTNVRFSDVHVVEQVAAITEVPALDVGGGAGIDPVGAVFQTRNVHPTDGSPLTMSADERYLGNPVANAQALVAKAASLGEFDGSHLSVRRTNIAGGVLDWVESGNTLTGAGLGYLCNGDSMFHVNKGAIAFRVDGTRDVKLNNTSVLGLTNLGPEGSDVCGDYRDGRSHSAATLKGYGGSAVRAYTFAGTRHADVNSALAQDLTAHAGAVVGFDVLTDTGDVRLRNTVIRRATAGIIPAIGPNPPATAHAIRVGHDAGSVRISGVCAADLKGADAQAIVADDGAHTTARGLNNGCRSGG